MTVSAVILAAGRGIRMQSGENKAFLPIRGQALIWYSVSAFTRIPEISELIVVACPEEIERVRRVILSTDREVRFVEGGETRRDSALCGVRAATGDFVLIHDGARPFPSPALIRRVLVSVRQTNAVIPVLPISDLIHRLGPAGHIEGIADLGEASLVRAQTPQGFRRDLILRGLEEARPGIRDDATAVLLAGESVSTVPGEPTNIKVTCPEDLALAEAIAASLERTHSG